MTPDPALDLSSYSDRPWVSSFPQGYPVDLDLEHSSVLGMLTEALSRPERTLVHYFGTDLNVGEVDRLSDALAVGLDELGVSPHDRVALYLQNVPQFLISLLAIWKLNATVVPINPMLKERELRVVLDDAEVCALVTLESLYRDVAASVVPQTSVRCVVTTSELDLVGDEVRPALLAGIERCPPADGAADLLSLCQKHEGRLPKDTAPSPDDIALLSYTSGTTGIPKAAMNSHGNVSFNAQAKRIWFGLSTDDTILGLAPLFHITGLIAECALSLCVPAPLIMTYRFEPRTVLQLIERYRPTFSIGAITAYIALMNDPECTSFDLSSLQRVFSGGAPVSPQVAGAFERELGLRIHNSYGLTETTAATHITPFGSEPRVDALSGALSIGVPYFNTRVRIVDDDGIEAPVGEIGELFVSGPQVVAGYWRRPEETALAFEEGELRTGDVGFMDGDGWFYLVDRKKDMIIASGYKVWPREVEDVLYEHPAVREAAVIGVPDPYRGETVKAFVSLRPNAELDPDEAIEFCRQRLAAYKYPRLIEIVDELPKSLSGKILRRELRSPT